MSTDDKAWPFPTKPRSTDKHIEGKTDLIGIADRIKDARGSQDAAAFGFNVFLYKHESIDVENTLRAHRSSERQSALADELEALGAKATEGPWAWDQRGEKVNEWGLGVAMDRNERQLVGRFDDEDVVYVEYVCSHEAATCNYGDPELICALRNNLQAIVAALRVHPSATQRTHEEEPYFWLNGYRKEWRRYSHFAGNVVSYDDVVVWSGINSDSEVIRERVYTVTYAMPHGSDRRDGSLAEGESVAFENGMVFNVTRTSNA